jgi:hypothetical protein
MVTTKMTELEPNVQYYTDPFRDCVVTLEKYENRTVFLKPIDPNQLGGYIVDYDGLIQFPLDDVFEFINV